MRIATVVGNRPQLVKAAAVSRPLRERHDEVLIHTGQHYDDALSAIFFRELELPAPDHELGLGGGTNAEQVGRMLPALARLLAQLAPDAVLVYGDTNTTLAGALAAAELGLALVHVEAGMRSFDRAMAEERNRVLTDHLATLLACSSQTAVENLRREGVAEGVVLIGDVMVDVARMTSPLARRREPLQAHGLRAGEYLLMTAHRAETVDDPARLAALVELLAALPGPVLAALHPRTRERLEQTGLGDRLEALPGLVRTGPLGYLDFTALLHQARAVLTDSGGVQKEAYLAGVRCLTLRARTEWVETVTAGWNTLVDLDIEAALAALERDPPAERPALYGDGRAGERLVAALEGIISTASSD